MATKGIPLSQQHKENIAKAIRLKHKEWKILGGGRRRWKKDELNIFGDPGGVEITFHEKSIARDLLIFEIKKIRPNIILDFSTGSFGIEVGDFSVMVDGYPLEELRKKGKELKLAGHRLYIRERILSRKDYKRPRGRKKK
jgi:hypothetical protein